LQAAGGFVLEQPPQSLRQPKVASRPYIHESTVAFQQRHHVAIVLGICFIHRRAGGINVRVRGRSVLQQDFRHSVLTQDRALPERLTPGVHDLLELGDALALVGVEPEVEQQRQHVRSL
jgi:hypothetical protein